MSPNRFDSLIDYWDAQLRKSFLESVYQLRDQAQIDQIARMLERGDVTGALRAVGLDPVAFRPLDRALAEAFEDGGGTTARSIPATRDAQGARMVVQFNVRHPRAEQWLRDHSSTMIREIIDDQRAMIRQNLLSGMSQGLNPRTVALDLVGRLNRTTGRREGGLIGLTASQERWVSRYAAELASDAPAAALAREVRDKRFDAAVRRAQAAGGPVPAELRAKMVMAYRNRALRYRAETIARTESLRSLHEAQEETMRQAVDAGAVDQTNVTFIWRTARDKRVRDTHWIMNGDRVRMGEAFITGSGARLRFPGDPLGPIAEVINCRCWREPKIDFLAGVS